jgi:hypothetical protein
MIRGILGALAFSAVIAIQPASADTITFGKGTIGAPPIDFEFWRTGEGGPGRWIVVRDETAEGGLALEQTSDEPTDYRFPLAIYEPLSERNVEVRVRFKAMAGKIDRAAGIAVRVTSADDYYVVRANALENNLRFYRVVKGKREQISGASAKVSSNEWHTLGLRAEGERFTISFDGRQLFTATDKTFSHTGKVALWTKADSITRFDRIMIEALR